MIPQEVLKQVRRIQIYTNRTVNEVFAGEYESTFKGRGMEFDEVREYMPGDDVRSIDWNVTARMGRPFIKRFVEERELTVMLVVDMSASGEFGTAQQYKNALAAELCAVLAFSAIKNNDKVGLITFTDRIERFIVPRKGTQHVLCVIRELLYGQAGSKKTDIAMALEYLAKVLKKRAIVFLVSDFMDTDFEMPLRLVNKRHDVIGLVVRDRREVKMPSVGLMEMTDAETGDVAVVDTSSKAFRQDYHELTTKRREALEQMLRSVNVDCINVSTGKPYIQELVRFFHTREKRR